mmetsp:Transcript_860/g.1044  ORF Transcript_860/g.1044 Transcript_860/m.1044 type:complete len:330 (+) Transcript_860:85-1074(+)
MGSRKEADYLPTMLGSTVSGVLARFPFHPIDTCKSRLQTQLWLSENSRTHKIYYGLPDAARTIWKREGLRGLYRGFGPTAFGSAPASCIYFTTYELSKDFLTRKVGGEGDAFHVHFLSGLTAETVSCVLWVPIDVVKERMQIQRVPDPKSVKPGSLYYKNGYQAITHIIKTEGLAGFYRGYGATLVSFGPFSGFYFLFYEKFKNFAKSIGGYSSEKDMPFWAFLLCGAGAGSGAALVTNPLDLVKLRLQIQRGQANSNKGGKTTAKPLSISKVEYKNILDGLVKLYKYEGIAGFACGVQARMLFFGTSTALSIALFESLKLGFQDVLGG